MSKASNVKPIQEIEFQNKLNQVIKVGDPVVAVVCGSGNADIRTGTYLGIRKNPSYWNKDSVSVIIAVNKKKTKLVHKETGEDYDFKAEARENPYPAYPYHVSGYSYSDRSALAEKARADARKEYEAKSVAHREKQEELRKDYEYRVFPFIGRTSLQLNKVYPADIALKDAVL